MTSCKAPTKESLRERWDMFADAYTEHLEPATVPLALTMFSALGVHTIPAGNEILDIGVGPGMAIHAMQGMLREGVSVTAVDLSERMLAIARRRLPESVKLVAADAEDLPFPADRFACVWSNLCLHLVVNPDRMLAEAFRVAKPGALVGFTAWGNMALSPFITIQMTMMKELGVPAPCSERSPFCLAANEEALLDRIRRAGFDNVRSWHQPVVPCMQSGAEYTQFVNSFMPGTRALLEKLEPAVVARLNDRMTALADEVLAEGGPLQIDMIVITARKPGPD